MKKFILVDCNNFFVSCERVFNPKLINKPVVVLSNNDGCVISRSNEAKSLSIAMGAPAFECEHIFKKYNIQVFSSNFALYADMSARVMDTLESLATDIEIYSIDEAFLFISDINQMDSNYLINYCYYIKNQVKQRTGIPVSLGIGPTKTLAKIANKIAKKNSEINNVFDITNCTDIDKLLSLIDVSDVWGVGFRYSRFLKSKGILTAYDLKYACNEWIKKNLTILGLKMVYELRGIPCYDLDINPNTRKSVIVSKSFGNPVTQILDLKEAVSNFTVRAAQKLRDQGLVALNLTVFIATNRYHEYKRYFNSANVRLSIATSYTPDLLRASQICIEKIFKSGFFYKKAGVILTDLIFENQIQISINKNFPDFSKQFNLMKVCDKIDARWGQKYLTFASTGINQLWKSKRLKQSQRFTTNWHEILTIYI